MDVTMQHIVCRHDVMVQLALVSICTWSQWTIKRRVIEAARVQCSHLFQWDNKNQSFTFTSHSASRVWLSVRHLFSTWRRRGRVLLHCPGSDHLWPPGDDLTATGTAQGQCVCACRSLKHPKIYSIYWLLFQLLS